jgi:hypothetical protein
MAAREKAGHSWIERCLADGRTAAISGHWAPVEELDYGTLKSHPGGIVQRRFAADL